MGSDEEQESEKVTERQRKREGRNNITLNNYI